MKQYMLDAGFVDVEEQKFVWPIGAWPKDPKLKDLGRWGERNWADGLEGWVLALYTRILGVSYFLCQRAFLFCFRRIKFVRGNLISLWQWTYTQVQQFVKEFRTVIKDRKNHYYHEVRCVYGRKPFPHEVPATQASDSESPLKPSPSPATEL
jgi:hypothetical protein